VRPTAHSRFFRTPITSEISAAFLHTNSASRGGSRRGKSATKSAMVNQFRGRRPRSREFARPLWPRATRSSLKPHISSIEPPPRPTIITSTSGNFCARAIPAQIELGAPSPCTRAGITVTRRPANAGREYLNIANGGARRRGHHRHMPRQSWKRAFAVSVKQTSLPIFS